MRRVFTLPALAFAIFACSDMTGPENLREIAVSSAPSAATAPFAYVANGRSDDVSVIETATNTVIATVDVGPNPSGVAVTPDGGFAYVTSQFPGTVSVISTATNSVVATIPVGDFAVGVAITPDGSHAYVTNSGPSTVSIIETATNTVVATVPVGPGPVDVAITPDGAFAYVSNNNSSTVSVIATATNAVVGTVTLSPGPAFTGPRGVDVSPDGASIYVANNNAFSAVSVIAAATNTVVATIPISSNPNDVAITPDGAFAYVTSPRQGGGLVTVIETVGNTEVASVTISGENANAVAITPDGAFAYVTASSASTSAGSVTVIETATNTVLDVIAVGSFARAIAITAAVPPVIPIDIDIKPGSDPNSINLKSKGVVPVAILGSDEFDVNDIDRASLLFGPGGAAPTHPALGHPDDVNDDGFMDLVSHYRQQETGLATGDLEACVTGETLTGTAIKGCDAVRVLDTPTPLPGPPTFTGEWTGTLTSDAELFQVVMFLEQIGNDVTGLMIEPTDVDVTGSVLGKRKLDMVGQLLVDPTSRFEGTLELSAKGDKMGGTLELIQLGGVRGPFVVDLDRQ